MNWDIVEGNWNQFKGKVKARWGNLTDDHLEVIAGKRVALVGKVQEAYGISKNDAEKQIRHFEMRNKDYRPKNPPEPAAPGAATRRTAGLPIKLENQR